MTVLSSVDNSVGVYVVIMCEWERETVNAVLPPLPSVGSPVCVCEWERETVNAVLPPLPSVGSPVCVCVRERESERDSNKYICVCMCVCVL